MVLYTGATNVNILKVIGTVENKLEVEIILDTGSSQCVIDKSLVKEIKPMESQINLIAAGGVRLLPLGIAEVYIRLGDLSGYINAVVIEKLSKPLILGTNFLNKNNARIDYGQQTVELINDDIRTTLRFGNDDDCLPPKQTQVHNLEIICEKSEEEKERLKVTLKNDYILKYNQDVSIQIEVERINIS